MTTDVTFRKEERDACIRMHRLALHLAGALCCSAALRTLPSGDQILLLVSSAHTLWGRWFLPRVTSWPALVKVWASPCPLALCMSAARCDAS